MPSWTDLKMQSVTTSKARIREQAKQHSTKRSDGKYFEKIGPRQHNTHRRQQSSKRYGCSTRSGTANTPRETLVSTHFIALMGPLSRIRRHQKHLLSRPSQNA
uniref:Uncharacterized protein n=1 Tax=Caenorhabditis japonica TaxID=281687 RepID=A0A8R1EJJ0_CAEJA